MNEERTVWLQEHNLYADTKSSDARQIKYMADIQHFRRSRDNYYSLTPLDTTREEITKRALTGGEEGLLDKGLGLAGGAVRGAASGVVGGVQALQRLGVGSMMDLFNTLRYNYEKNKLTDRVTWINTNIKRENYASDEEWQAARESALQQYRNDLAEVERRFVNVADFGREEMAKLKTRHENWMKHAGLAKEEGDGFFYDIGQGAGSLLSALAVTFITKSPSAAAALFGGIAGRQGYEEALENGVAPERALWTGAAAGTAEGVLERVGLDVFLRGLSARGWWRRVLKNALTESVQEGSQGIAEEVILGTMGGREKEAEEVLKDVAYQALLGGLVGGGVAGIPGVGRMFAEYSETDLQEMAREREQTLRAPTVEEAEELVQTNEGRELTAEERYRLILANGVRRLTDLGVSEEKAQRAVAQVILEAGSERSIAEVRQMLNDENNPATYTNNDILTNIKEFAEAVRATSKRLTPEYLKQTYDIRDRVTQEALEAGYPEQEAQAAGQLQQAFSQLAYQITGIAPAEWYERNLIQFRRKGAQQPAQTQQEINTPQAPQTQVVGAQTEQNAPSVSAPAEAAFAQENDLNAAREYYRRREEEQAMADAEANAALENRLQEEGINPDDLYFQQPNSYDAQGKARTDTPQFKAWFAGSKVVDENGKPLVVYHGTKSDFGIFDLTKGGRSNEEASIGFWFSPSKDVADNFVKGIWYGDKEKKLMPLYLNLKNPKIYEAAKIDYAALNKLNERITSLEEENNALYNKTGRENIRRANFWIYLSEEDFLEASKYMDKEDAFNARKFLINEKELAKLRFQKEKIVKNDAYHQYQNDLDLFSEFYFHRYGSKDYVSGSHLIGAGRKNAKQAAEKLREKLIKEGYDGIIIKDTKFDVAEGKPVSQIVAFFPEQIKSVYNRGTWSADNPNIYYQKAYHGSPHRFDAFSTDAIGTGEGAQSNQNPSFAEELDAVLKAAPNQTEKAVVGKVSPQLSTAAKEHGLNIDGYIHNIDTSAVQHTRKRHGIPQREERRGQLAVTDDDFKNIPQIIYNPDFVAFGAKNNKGLDLIIYGKNMPDGSSVYVEEIRTGKKTLTTNSLRKYKTGVNPSSFAKRISNAHGDTGTISIVGKEDFVKPEEEKTGDLFATHDMTLLGATQALKMGGLAMPSMAIRKRDGAKPAGFGDVSFVAYDKMVTPSRGTEVYDRDAWTPSIYRQLRYKISPKTREHIRNVLKENNEEKRFTVYVYNIQDKMANPTSNELALELFLKEKGLPETARQEYWDSPEYLSWYNETLFKDATPYLFTENDSNTDMIERKFTLGNIMKILRRQERASGAQIGDYIFSVRELIRYFPQKFRNLQEVRNKKANLRDRQEIQTIIEHLDEDFSSLVTELRTEGKEKEYGADMHAVGLAIVNHGDREAQEYWLKAAGLPSDEQTIRKINKFADRLKNEVPSEYFEVKPRRVIEFGQFAGVIMPNSQEFDSLADELRDKYNLPVVRIERGNAEQYQKALAEIQQQVPSVFFQNAVNKSGLELVKKVKNNLGKEVEARLGKIDYLEWSNERNWRNRRSSERSLPDVYIETRGAYYYVYDNKGNLILKKQINSTGTRVKFASAVDDLRSQLAELEGIVNRNEKINRDNFFRDTNANFVSAEKPDRPADYVSSSGSAYWYEDGGVYRSSDHWGSNIASCNWYLDGENISSWDDEKGERTGFAKWSDFTSNVSWRYQARMAQLRQAIDEYEKGKAVYLQRIQQEQEEQEPLGMTQFTDTAAVITLLEHANKSTLLHEMGHVFLRQLERLQQEYDTPLMRQYTQALEAFLGAKQNGRFYSREQQERFARSFLSYVRENEAPTEEMRGVFERFKEWLNEIYESIRGTEFFERISPQAKEFFDEILAPVDVETPPMTLYQGQEENIRKAVEDIRNNRLPDENTGLTLKDIKGLFSQLRKRKPRKPQHNLLKDLRHYGAEYANAGQIDQEAYKNARVFDKKGGVGDMPDVWLRDKGYMSFEESTEETRAQAWDMIERALSGEEIYRLEDQEAAQRREDYVRELEIVRNIARDYVDAQFIMRQIEDMEEKGYRAVDMVDAKMLRDGFDKLRRMAGDAKKEMKDLKNELVGELRKRVDEDGALDAALSDIINAKTKEQIANRFRRAEKVIINSIIKQAAGVSPVVNVDEAYYDRVREEAGKELNAQQRLEQKGIHKLKESGFWSKALVPVSTRLRQISLPLMYKMRRFLARSSRKNNENLKKITPFLQGLRALQIRDRAEWKVLDMALKNRDARTRDRILRQNGLLEEFLKVRDLLNDMYRRAAAVGLDVNFLTEYFPRKVINPAEFISYMQGTAQWSEIERQLEKADPNKKFTEEEIVNFINNWLRGYSNRDLARGVPGNLKERQITFITQDMDAFYKSSDQALLDYVVSVEKAIQAKTILGLDLNKYEESIGSVINQLLKTGKLNYVKEKELKKIISAIMKPDSTGSTVSFIKNAGYIMTMGNPLSAVTQLGDLAFSAYSSGVWGTVQTAVGQKAITVEDLGLEQLAQEFFEPRKTFKGDNALAKFANVVISPKAVDTTFKLVFLNKIDRLGKETFVNSKYQALQRQANEKPQQLMDYLTRFMSEKEAAEIMKDLHDGVVSENVKDLLFSEISEFQPVSLLEMPEYYLTHGGSRLFYALKTYTIKQIDIFRNQCFDRMLNGNRDEKIQAFKDFMRLCILVMIANAGADTLKDLILGRQIDLEDLAVDNLLRLTGLSKYQLYRFKDSRQNLGIAAAYMIMPPALSLPTDIFWDGYRVAHGTKDFKDMRIFSNIPGFGKMYYWWFGGGKAITEKDNKEKGLFKITGWAGEI